MTEHSLLDRLDWLQSRFEEVSTLIASPDAVSDMKRYVRLNKEYRDLEQIVLARREYLQLINNINEAKALLEHESDAELREMAREELNKETARQPQLEEKIKLMLIPADPQDSKNAIVEIRGGTGGDEAAIFAGDLFRMYSKYCESKNWKVEVTNSNPGTSGGYKEIIFTVSGEQVYGTLKYESGVHRVQRVPLTETQGRVHTSAATVAVLPEAEEFDVELNESDIKVDTFVLPTRRAVCQHYLFGRPPAAYSHRCRGTMPGRTFATEKQSQSHERIALAPLRHGIPKIPGRDLFET